MGDIKVTHSKVSDYYSTGHNVDVYDDSVSKNHGRQSAEVSMGTSTSDRSTSTPEEIDLSLDPEKNTQTDQQGVKAGAPKDNDITADGAKTSNDGSTANMGTSGGGSPSGGTGQTSMNTSNPTASSDSPDTGNAAGNNEMNNGANQGAGQRDQNANTAVDGQNMNNENNGQLNGNSTTNTDVSGGTGAGNQTAGLGTGDNANAGGAAGGQDTETDLSAEAAESTIEDNSGLKIEGNKVTITYTDDYGQEATAEMELDDYKQMLRRNGLIDKDIQRVIDGRIQIVDLYEEINADPDNTRRKLIVEAQYLNAFGYEFSEIDDLLTEIENQEKELERLKEEKKSVCNDEYDFLSYVVSELAAGWNLEDIQAYKYVDKDGITRITTVPPTYMYNPDDPEYIEYIPVTFEEMYPDNEYYKKLKELTAEEVGTIFSKETHTIHRWTGTDEQYDILYEILDKSEEVRAEREAKLKPLQEELETLYGNLEKNKAIYDYINAEVSYYMDNVDSYIHLDDFADYMEANPSNYIDTLNTLIDQAYGGVAVAGYGTYAIPQIYLTDRDQMIDILAAIINGECDGIITKGYNTYVINSNDTIFNHLKELHNYMSEEEKAIFNYKLNKEGRDAAYAYLEDIAVELDQRALQEKMRKDQEFASEHPVLASLYSIFVTPIEGIVAFSASMNSIITGDRIWRIDVYSSGDVMRNQVAADIAEFNPTLSFIYSTAMSMADSAVLIGIGIATGGTGMVLISAATMGSRAYVSTLNDALDRGISDGKAVALAFTAAVVETAMEYYSAGHLLNLEGGLNKSVLNVGAKIANKVSNPALANVLTKAFYIGASAVSQGICEGEEEFATEILNYAADMIISQELSNYQVALDRYKAIGYDEATALNMIGISFIKQCGEAFLGGFISGVCFGAFGSLRSTHTVSQAISKEMLTEIEGTKSAELFANTLIENQVQMENIQEAQKKLSKIETNDMSTGKKIVAKAKGLATSLLGIDTITVDDIRLGMQTGKITAEEARLMLQGTVIQNIRHEMKTEFFKNVGEFVKQIKNKINGTQLSSDASDAMTATVKSGALGDIGTNQQQAIINNTKYAATQLMIKYGCSYLEALNNIKKGIITHDFSYFTSYGNSREMMKQFSWNEIAEGYTAVYHEYLEQITTDVETVAQSLVERWKNEPNYTIEDAINTINQYINGQIGIKYITSLNDSKSIVQKYTVEELNLGLQNYVQILNAMSNVRNVIELYKQKYNELSYDQIIENIEIYLRTHNLAKITRNGGARNIIANMTDYEISSALARIKGEYISETIKEQNNEVEEVFNNLWNAISRNRKSDYRATCLLYQGLYAQVQNNQRYALKMAQQLTSIFNNNRGLSITSTTPSGSYWSQYNNHVHMGSLNIEMGDIGTMMHEFGHCLFDTILNTALPYGSVQVIAEAADYATRNRKAYESAIRKVTNDVWNQVEQEFREDLHAKGLTIEQYKNQLAAKYAYGNLNTELAKKLRELGIKEKELKKIVSRTLTVQAAVEEEINTKKRVMSDRIWRTQHSSLVAISDIMDAVFMGSNVDNRGKNIETSYAHGDEYYRDSGNPKEFQFHEMIANFTQIMVTGNSQDIQLLTTTFGSNFVHMLDQIFKVIIGEQQTIDTRAYNINPPKVPNNGIFGKMKKGIFGAPIKENTSVNMDASVSTFTPPVGIDTNIDTEFENDFLEYVGVKCLADDVDTSIEMQDLLWENLKQQIEAGNPYARLFTEQLIKAFKKDTWITISSQENESFWSTRENKINISKAMIEAQNPGVFYHELTHLLHHKIMKANVPSITAQYFANAMKYAETHINKFNKTMLEKLIIIQDMSNAEFDKWIKEQYGTIENYRQHLAEKYKTIQEADTDGDITLKKLGFSDEKIKELMAKAVDQEVAAQKGKIREKLWRQYFSVYTALSDIINAIFKGAEKTSRGIEIEAYFGHNYSNLTDEQATYRQLSETLADFANIVLNGKQEVIQLLYETCGIEFVDLINSAFLELIGKEILPNELPEIYDTEGKQILYYDATPDNAKMDAALEAAEQKIEGRVTLSPEDGPEITLFENIDTDIQALINVPNGCKGRFITPNGVKSYYGTIIAEETIYEIENPDGTISRYFLTGTFKKEKGKLKVDGAIKHQYETVRDSALLLEYKSEDISRFIEQIKEFQTKIGKEVVSNEMIERLELELTGTTILVKNDVLTKIFDKLLKDKNIKQQLFEMYGKEVLPTRQISTAGLEQLVKMANLENYVDLSKIYEGNANIETQADRIRKIAAVAIQRIYGMALDNFHQQNYLYINENSIETRNSTENIIGIPLLYDATTTSATTAKPDTYEALAQDTIKIIEIIASKSDAETLKRTGVPIAIRHMEDITQSKIGVENGLFAQKNGDNVIQRDPQLGAKHQSKTSMKDSFLEVLKQKTVTPKELTIEETTAIEEAYRKQIDEKRANIEEIKIEIEPLKPKSRKEKPSPRLIELNKEIRSIEAEIKGIEAELEFFRLTHVQTREEFDILADTQIDPIIEEIKKVAVTAFDYGNKFYLEDESLRAIAANQSLKLIDILVKDDIIIANIKEAIKNLTEKGHMGAADTEITKQIINILLTINI